MITDPFETPLVTSTQSEREYYASGMRPPIWRRVQVPRAIRLAALHAVIQTVFGWTDSHLHQFVVAGRTYGQPDDFDEAVEDESGVTLAQALVTRNKRFLYVYDFGDNWEHDVVVENIVTGNSGVDPALESFPDGNACGYSNRDPQG